jgi:hypothetical protein
VSMICLVLGIVNMLQIINIIIFWGRTHYLRNNFVELSFEFMGHILKDSDGHNSSDNY